MLYDSKKTFADALLRLFEKKSLSTITTTEIIVESRLARQTFYNHFCDKFDLVNYIYHSNIHEIWVRSVVEHSWESAITNILEYVMANKGFYTQAISLAGSSSFLEFLQQDMVQSIKIIAREKTGMATLAPELLFQIDFYSFATAGIMIQWVRSGMIETPARIAALCCESMPEKLKECLHGNSCPSK